MGKKFHNGMINGVINAPVNTFFDVTPVGKIQHRFSGDLENIEGWAPHLINWTMGHTFWSFSMLYVCLSTTPIILLPLIPFALISYKFMRYASKAKK